MVVAACTGDPGAGRRPAPGGVAGAGASGDPSGAGGQASGQGGGGGSAGAFDGVGGTSTFPPDAIVVSDVAELRAALIAAEPGDYIVLDAGTYAAPDKYSLEYAGSNRSAYFYSHASGTPEEPITLASAHPADKAELHGLGTSDSAYLLWLKGENWVVKDVVLRSGGKGLMLDEASGSHVDGVEVYDVGDEGIHLRSGTSNTLVENCVIDGTGKTQPGFGEGIYIGSDHGQWDNYDKACNGNTIRACTIRDTAAEAIDVKEGTTNTVIEQCQIYGGSISGVNFADSFIDLKGDAARVRNNAFFKEGNALVTRGVAIVERPQGPTATNNWIYDNAFSMDDATGYMVHAYDGSGNHAWDNTRTPSGQEYAGNAPELAFTDPR
jgi:endoglucanase